MAQRRTARGRHPSQPRFNAHVARLPGRCAGQNSFVPWRKLSCVELHFDGAALARMRFAISPLHELDGLLRGLTGLGGAALPRGWTASLQPRLAELRRTTEINAVLALQRLDGGADFMVPPPTSVDQTVGQDLEAVAATPPHILRREVDECLAGRPEIPDSIREMLLSADAAARVARALGQAWTALLASEWPAVQAVCQRDIGWRVERLGRGGWPAAFEDMHSKLIWDSHYLRVEDSNERTVVLSKEGMVLVPSAFAYPALIVLDSQPWPIAIVYPARGSGLLREVSREEASVAETLSQLIGTSRASILLALDGPSSTTQLAHSLGLVVGAVGDHLAVLRRAGLVSRVRAGRSVFYQRTVSGDRLIVAGKHDSSPQPQDQ